MGWRDKFLVIRDQVDEVKFRATERWVRCPDTNADGKQCDLDKGHNGNHENGGDSW